MLLVSKIEINNTCEFKGETLVGTGLKLEATKDGIMVETPWAIFHMNNEDVYDYVEQYVLSEQLTEIEIIVYSKPSKSIECYEKAEETKIVHIEQTMKGIIKQYALSMENRLLIAKATDEEYMADVDCEDDESPIRHFLGKAISYWRNKLINTCKWLHNYDDLKGKECPVLMTPLRPDNTRIFDTCKHLISQEAFSRLPTTDGKIKCPLCRAETHPTGTTLYSYYKTYNA